MLYGLLKYSAKTQKPSAFVADTKSKRVSGNRRNLVRAHDQKPSRTGVAIMPYGAITAHPLVIMLSALT